MKAAERWRVLEAGFPRGWSEARLVLTVDDGDEPERAALILASLAPGRSGATFRFSVVSPGVPGATSDAAHRALERLDDAGIAVRLNLSGTDSAPPRSARVTERRGVLAGDWDALLERLPADWSDVYAEVELSSSADAERGALLLAPANPSLGRDVRPAFRFRCARSFGYGVAPVMARRVLERLDEEGIGGAVRILHVFSRTSTVSTQGPVWRIGGRAV